jgi:hypothetical protein
MLIKTIDDLNAALDTPYAWPGGYPHHFMMIDGATLCHNCATANRSELEAALIDDDRSSGWMPHRMDINWEDTDLFCDHCGELIASAYGDDNSNDTEE